MKDKTVARIFGLARGGAGYAEFCGEIVTVSRIRDDRAYFFHRGSEFDAHPKQFTPVSLRYPNVIYVKEPASELSNQEELVVVKTEISNCYARGGSHWIRYYVDPDSLILTDEEDEDKAAELAREAGDVVVSYQRLHTLLTEKFPDLSYEEIQDLINQI